MKFEWSPPARVGRAAALLAASAVVLSGVAAGSASAATTVGQTGVPYSGFAWRHNLEVVQPTSAISADSGDTVTSFQTVAASSRDCSLIGYTGVYDFQVLRPLGNAQYQVIGHTGDQTDPCDGQSHSYPVNIPVQPGDVLGVYVTQYWIGYLYGVPGTAITAKIGEPANGSSFAAYGSTGAAVDESATVESSIPNRLAALLDASTGVGPGVSLAAKVRQAQASYQAGDTAGTCSALADFISQVSALNGKKLTADQAQQLTAAAQSISTQLGC